MTPEWHADEEDLLREFNNPHTSWNRKAHILLTLAYKASNKRKIGLELIYLESGLQLSIEHKLIPEQTQFRITLARVMFNVQENLPKAEEYALEAEAMLPDFSIDHDVLEQKAHLSNILGKIYFATERYAEAFHQFKNQVDLNIILKEDRGVATGYEKAAESLVELGEIEEAEEYANQAREIYVEHESLTDICDVDRILARIMLGKNMPKPAAELLTSVRDAERVLHDGTRPQTKLWLGIALIGCGDYPKAERLLKQVRNSSYKWDREFKIAKLASEALAGLLFQLGRDAEARKILSQANAMTRLLTKEVDNDGPFREIDNLLVSDQKEAALIAAGELVRQKCGEGDISGRWRAQLKEIICHRDKKDSKAIVELWDSLSTSGLDFQDDIVIQFKNIVSHALYKVGRLAEASDLNSAVLNDYRLEANIQEKAYAQENKARFLKAEKKIAQAKKWADSAVENNILIGNNDRALKILKIFKTDSGPKDSNGGSESYK